jgi:hypothetical protein
MIIEPNIRSIFDNVKKCFNGMKSIRRIGDDGDDGGSGGEGKI